ncbi:hypothetical protein ACWEVD_04985 [Nocardia thailandica]|uniref:DUF4926 domain-containing protein n=1 Tax=Nocardia thailandica TaxID=257275 RepID=A0ABW6PVG4_9NOCA|nr:hypothetical protein [Nocardia thailandica]
MPEFSIGDDICWTTSHRGADGVEWGTLLELTGPVTGIDRDLVSGEVVAYVIEARVGRRPAGLVLVPGAEAVAAPWPADLTWCAEFT